MARLGIITGMAFEADILHSAAARLSEEQRPLIVCHGFGRSASRRAALEAVNSGAEALLSFGICGGLDPAAKAGDVLTAREVRDGTQNLAADAGWTDRMYARLGGGLRGAIAHGPRVLTTPAEKRALFETSKASAVDMESFGVAEIAAMRGVPFAALRVVADTAADELPDVAVAAVTAEGHVRVMKSVMGALAHPQQIPSLIWLGRRTKAARGVLVGLADLGLARGFFL